MDLFEQYDQLPPEVQEVINNHAETNDFQACEDLIRDLNKLGYTCSYSLDCVPYDLKKI